MTATRSRNQSVSLAGRLADLWDALFISGDITSIVATIVLLLMPALSLDAADWPLSLSIVVPTLVISVIFGYFLSRSRYNELFALIVSGIYGLVFVLLIAAFTQSSNPVRGVEIVMARAFQWVIDAATGGINQDNLVFSLVVSTLFWFFGYNAAWHIFRLDRVWRVIIPPGLILLVNMVVYAGEVNLDLYLLIFAFMALLLIVRSNLDAREWDWYTNGVRVPKRLRYQFLSVGAGISLIALLLAWAIPSGNLQERLDNFQQFLASDPMQRMTEFWNRLVEPVEAEGPATADYYGGETLNLGGAIRLGDQVIMLAAAPTDYRYYWKARVFERYVNGHWSPSATRRVPDLVEPLEIVYPDGSNGARVAVNQTITMSIASRLIHTAPQPLSIDVAGRIDLLRTSGNQDDANSPMNVSVIRPRRVIERGVSYNAISLVSVATAFELRAAPTTYPEWVANPNTNPAGVSGRVAGLANQIVTDAGATNPYDRAKAIETWLRTNIQYNETIPEPPPGVDAIEWFLFDIQQGYCTYYATAMISMLRSLGIPARMAAGFAQGEYDAEFGQYVVREKDAHTWVEVYFPGYGWVEFEPTSAQAPLNREGDTAQPQENPITSAATSQPTESPTPLPSPTPFATSTPQDDQSPQDPDSPPTTTPTPSPTPTATPVIVPTFAPPIQPPEPQDTSFLSFLLPALGIAVLIILAVILLVLLAVFAWWWWEWRGMGGLSPITRAYSRLNRYLALIGFRSNEHETPEERRRKIVQKIPQAERPVTAITRLYQVEQYAPSQDGTQEGARNQQIADNAWTEARRNIIVRWLRSLVPWLKD
jgi:transglutaminase-like putative cysteine protease